VIPSSKWAYHHLVNSEGAAQEACIVKIGMTNFANIAE